LTWHYRSRHEELIAFSNAAFYGGQLVTAPRAQEKSEPEMEGLHWLRVNGVWENQCNRVEAEAVVDLLFRLLEMKKDGLHAPSLGIVTFNLKQAELIREIIEYRKVEDEKCRRIMAKEYQRPPMEQLFIRNLENVQGDERDVIVFSLGYGPSAEEGIVHARFGPVGQVGGEKRLNVAFTRAKIGCWIVSSVDPGDLKVDKTKNVGPKLLREYLAFVQSMSRGDIFEAQSYLERAQLLGGFDGRASESENRAESAPSRPLLALVCESLREKGLFVQKDFGVAKNRIDVAVGKKKDTFEVALDLSDFLRIEDPISRDVYRRSYLKRLGWKVKRVSPAMWAESKAETLQEICENFEPDT